MTWNIHTESYYENLLLTLAPGDCKRQKSQTGVRDVTVLLLLYASNETASKKIFFLTPAAPPRSQNLFSRLSNYFFTLVEI